MITSRQNERLKDIRRLRQCKDTRSRNGQDRASAGVVRAVLEGPHLVGEALDAGLPLSTTLMTPEFADGTAGRALAQRLPRPALHVAAPLLDELTDSDSPRGVVAVVDLPRRRLEDLPMAGGAVYVFAEGLQDPGNLGALARTAEASGVQALCLGPGCSHLQHPRALRASAGSLLRLPTVRVSLDALQGHLRQQAPRCLALVPRDGQDLYRSDLAAGCLVVLVGAEGPGLSDDARAAADVPLTIPMAPPVESLNATVAASLVLFEIRRQRLRAGE